ncbi:DNA damage-inducible transcript 4-like protein [Panulirus ornatus]|uniref:DNA damage-inducible transcript 4-like protein n=1 Tax=Panulirus ornatus TaxID=150431 RepID=UPI003A850835
MPPVIQGSPVSLSSITEEEEVESLEAQLIMRKLQSVLYRGVERYLTCDAFIVPRNTLLRASQDVLRLCTDRPHGLRSALVELFLSDGDSCKRLAQVVADPRQEVKTVIKLTLHQDDTSDPDTLHLRSGYTMERLCLP